MSALQKSYNPLVHLATDEKTKREIRKELMAADLENLNEKQAEKLIDKLKTNRYNQGTSNFKI